MIHHSLENMTYVSTIGRDIDTMIRKTSDSIENHAHIFEEENIRKHSRPGQWLNENDVNKKTSSTLSDLYKNTSCIKERNFQPSAGVPQQQEQNSSDPINVCQHNNLFSIVILYLVLSHSLLQNPSIVIQKTVRSITMELSCHHVHNQYLAYPFDVSTSSLEAI